MIDRYFDNRDGGLPLALSPIQVSEGMAEGLRELTQAELDKHLGLLQNKSVEALKEGVTQKRWEVETCGITLPSGIQVGTAIGDQNRITSVVANAERSGLDVFDFKAESGWVRVTLTELQGIAAAVAQHVQACFSAERLHHEAIDALAEQYKNDPAGLQAALDAYDESQGWPSPVLS